MTITVEIPDEVAGALANGGEDPARAVLEAVALEGYRADGLSEYEVQRLLGFETRMQVHGFLKERNVYLHYGLADLDHDMEEARQYRVLKGPRQPTELRAE